MKVNTNPFEVEANYVKPIDIDVYIVERDFDSIVLAEEDLV